MATTPVEIPADAYWNRAANNPVPYLIPAGVTELTHSAEDAARLERQPAEGRVEEDAGAAARLAVDEADAVAREVGEDGLRDFLGQLRRADLP